MKNLFQCITTDLIVPIISTAAAVAGLVYKIFRDNRARIVLSHEIRDFGKKRSIVVENIGEVDVKNIVIDSPNNNVQLPPFSGIKPYTVELLCSREKVSVHYNVCAGEGERLIRATYRSGLIKKSISIKAKG